MKNISRRDLLGSAGLGCLAANIVAAAETDEQTAVTETAVAGFVKGAPYKIVGEMNNYNPRRNIFSRSRHDPTVPSYGRRFRERTRDRIEAGTPGYSRVEYAALDAMWHNARNAADDGGPFEKSDMRSTGRRSRLLERYEPDDIEMLTRQTKKIAMMSGAAMVGICEVNPLWVFMNEQGRLFVPDTYKYAVVIAIEMDRDGIMTSPTAIAGAATGLGYSRMQFVSASVARFIRELGWDAAPTGNGLGLSIPLAIDAGLGELGRNGLLITPGYGPRVRLCKVFTNMPLVPDKPIEFGVAEFCDVCKRCAVHCPSNSISYGEMTAEPACASTNTGAMKWPINSETCYEFWCDNGSDCSNCIAVCPFNKPDSWVHDIVRVGIRFENRPLDRMFTKMDALMGYDRAGEDPARWWSKDRYIHLGGYKR